MTRITKELLANFLTYEGYVVTADTEFGDWMTTTYKDVKMHFLAMPENGILRVYSTMPFRENELEQKLVTKNAMKLSNSYMVKCFIDNRHHQVCVGYDFIYITAETLAPVYKEVFESIYLFYHEFVNMMNEDYRRIREDMENMKAMEAEANTTSDKPVS